MVTSRVFVWLLGIAVVSAPLGSSQSQDQADAKVLAEQLRLARAEGIPTSIPEFVASLPQVKPAENAGPAYQSIKKVSVTSKEIEKASLALLTGSDAKDFAKAERLLQENLEQVVAVDQASKKPHCRFRRDWSFGYAVLQPEASIVKDVCRLILLRGDIAARKGNANAAIANADEVLRVSAHFLEEPTALSQLVSRTYRSMALRSIARWSLQFHRSTRYLSRLKALTRSWPGVDLKAEHRSDLAFLLGLIDSCQTKEGRERLGIKDSDVSRVEGVRAWFPRPDEGRGMIVKGAREYWKALDLPVDQLEGASRKALTQVAQGVLAFPTAGRLWESLSPGDVTFALEVKGHQATQLEFEVFCRALAHWPPPKSMKTESFKSPFDGKPVDYSFDGKTVRIRVSQGEEGRGMALVIP